VSKAPEELSRLAVECQRFVASLEEPEAQFAATCTLLVMLLLEQRPFTVDVVFAEVKKRLRVANEVMKHGKGPRGMSQ